MTNMAIVPLAIALPENKKIQVRTLDCVTQDINVGVPEKVVACSVTDIKGREYYTAPLVAIDSLFIRNKPEDGKLVLTKMLAMRKEGGGQNTLNIRVPEGQTMGCVLHNKMLDCSLRG